MSLPIARGQYNQADEAEMRRQVDQSLSKKYERGQNIEVGAASLILTDANGVRWRVEVDNAGVLGTVAV